MTMKLGAFLLLGSPLLTGCGSLKSVGHGAKWTYDQATNGVQSAGGMAKKPWPFGKGAEAKAKAAETNLAVPAPRETPVPSYDAKKFWVADAEMGDHLQTAENATEDLREGWKVTAAKLTFSSDYPATPPNLLRAEGAPVKARKSAEGMVMEATALQIHYRQSTGLMVLKGSPTIVVGNHRVTAASPSTLLVISLEDGSFQAMGPIKSASFSR